MRRKWFARVSKLDEAHELYRQHAKKLHPDNFPDEQEKAKAHEEFVAMKAEYEQTVERITAPKKESKHVEKFARTMNKTVAKINVEPAQAKRITFHASKLAGAVAETVVTNFAKKILHVQE